jgi:PmbA protein
LAQESVDIKPGKYKVLMSPYVIGNIISYSSDFLSYHSVESGLSCFADKLNKQVSNSNFTLLDDPLDAGGVGFRLSDDEGTPARKNTLIESGVLKNYMHSYSTAKRSGGETTGNSGILNPVAWQLKVSPGKGRADDLVSQLEDGLWINNCWYTRYQDYRNAVFSTVPRDGVFYVKNGEIKGIAKGIRISDSVPSILANISAVSEDAKTVKWWEEIAPSTMPSVMVDNVNISRGF